ncbi:RidA family protein [Nitratireductor pacificus]|uniref:Endoribonuclease L-PSP n=1 Tax=Nitratireductor pacificus pht-3B TaxID=391937 RepID=K2MCS3_9HYPH|nr:RidA family protein [Nitratireductor pacificus]EKF19991.1 Endoribonuclease L-PSP [Nitratireductor pacificus pht-3B]
MIKRAEPTPTFHRVVEHNGTLLLAGVTGGRPTDDMATQTAAALARIDALLLAHGSDRAHVLHATVYITDMTLKDEMNKAWLAFFEAGALPARATLGVADLGPGVLIEIVAQAIVKD